jgi:hypothetical protein
MWRRLVEKRIMSSSFFVGIRRHFLFILYCFPQFDSILTFSQYYAVIVTGSRVKVKVNECGNPTESFGPHTHLSFVCHCSDVVFNIAWRVTMKNQGAVAA